MRGRKLKTLTYWQNFAAQKGGKCLSDTYEGIHIKMEWECAQGHRWSTTANTIRSGYWCPTCAKLHQTTLIKTIHDIGLERGGKCLSNEYIPHQKLQWECAQGHIWWASLESIQHHWCPTCAKNRSKLTIDDMEKFAQDRGGHCLSTVYVNANSKLQWCYAENHTWSSKAESIRQGHWCPTCARLHQKAPIALVQYAKSRDVTKIPRNDFFSRILKDNTVLKNALVS